MTLFLLIIIAMIFSWLEQHIKVNNYTDYGKHWYLINPRYHLPMFAIWSLTCYLAGEFWFIGLFAVIEDYFYFVFHPKDNLGQDDWIFRLMGGFQIGNFVFPYMYLTGIILSLFLYVIL